MEAANAGHTAYAGWLAGRLMLAEKTDDEDDGGRDDIHSKSITYPTRFAFLFLRDAPSQPHKYFS